MPISTDASFVHRRLRPKPITVYLFNDPALLPLVKKTIRERQPAGLIDKPTPNDQVVMSMTAPSLLGAPYVLNQREGTHKTDKELLEAILHTNDGNPTTILWSRPSEETTQTLMDNQGLTHLLYLREANIRADSERKSIDEMIQTLVPLAEHTPDKDLLISHLAKWVKKNPEASASDYLKTADWLLGQAMAPNGRLNQQVLADLVAEEGQAKVYINLHHELAMLAKHPTTTTLRDLCKVVGSHTARLYPEHRQVAVALENTAMDLLAIAEAPNKGKEDSRIPGYLISMLKDHKGLTSKQLFTLVKYTLIIAAQIRRADNDPVPLVYRTMRKIISTTKNM